MIWIIYQRYAFPLILKTVKIWTIKKNYCSSRKRLWVGIIWPSDLCCVVARMFWPTCRWCIWCCHARWGLSALGKAGCETPPRIRTQADEKSLHCWTSCNTKWPQRADPGQVSAALTMSPLYSWIEIEPIVLAKMNGKQWHSWPRRSDLHCVKVVPLEKHANKHTFWSIEFFLLIHILIDFILME